MSQAALNRGSEKRGRVSAERLAGAWGEGPGGSARARPRVETRAGVGGERWPRPQLRRLAARAGVRVARGAL